MFGNNPIRPPVKGDGQVLDVQSIFKTLQGEGPFTGHPSVFIRLGGCNLACTFCDTEFESFTPTSLDSIVDLVQSFAHDDHGKRTHQLVVLTGGEPFRQPIETLVGKLLGHGYHVQIETNGTLYRELPNDVSIICSPKVSGGSYHPIREDLLKHIDGFKFIISATNPDYQSVGDVGQEIYNTPIYVQPMDEQDSKKNLDNQAHALALAQAHGYILSLQTHKLLGIE